VWWRTLLGAAVIVLGLVAGCSGSDSGGDAPAQLTAVPHSCEEIARRERQASRGRRIRLAYVDEADWVRPFRSASFAVNSVDGDRAQAEMVEATGERNRYSIGLKKIDGHWLVDTSNVTLPSGH
jgi:hypothetical protein